MSWQGGDPADSAANVCIARGDTLFASVTATSLTANELTATFTVGLGLTSPDLAIDNGDRVCNVGVVFVGSRGRRLGHRLHRPDQLPPPDLGGEEPLPSTGGPPHAGRSSVALLALVRRHSCGRRHPPPDLRRSLPDV